MVWLGEAPSAFREGARLFSGHLLRFVIAVVLLGCQAVSERAPKFFSHEGDPWIYDRKPKQTTKPLSPPSLAEEEV